MFLIFYMLMILSELLFQYRSINMVVIGIETENTQSY